MYKRIAFIAGNNMCHVWGIVEVHAGIWWGNVKVRNHLEDLGIDGKLILKWVSNESFGRTWIRLICLKLRDKWREHVNALCTFGFYKMRKITLRAEELLAFQAGAYQWS